LLGDRPLCRGAQALWPDVEPKSNVLDQAELPDERRALQLGLRGAALARFADEWIVDIEDVTPLVVTQHIAVRAKRLAELMMPRERVYPVDDAELARRLRLG